MPFLGIHFTPGADREAPITIGPTATPAWGREHYTGSRGIEAKMAIKNAGILAKQYLLNRGNFRRYVHEQAFLNYRHYYKRAAKSLSPQSKKILKWLQSRNSISAL